MNKGALGFVEVYGLLGGIEAADAGLKAADVILIGYEKVKGGITTVKFKGDVAAVASAVEAAGEAVKKLGVLMSIHVIARADESIVDMLEKKVEECSEKEDVDAEQLIVNKNIAEEYELLVNDDSVLDEINVESQVIEENELSDNNENFSCNVDLESKTVEELRKITRSLGISTMTNKQIKFARKDTLIEEIKKFYQGRDN